MVGEHGYAQSGFVSMMLDTLCIRIVSIMLSTMMSVSAVPVDEGQLMIFCWRFWIADQCSWPTTDTSLLAFR
jgi:hypothetical protein